MCYLVAPLRVHSIWTSRIKSAENDMRRLACDVKALCGNDCDIGGDSMLCVGSDLTQTNICATDIYAQLGCFIRKLVALPNPCISWFGCIALLTRGSKGVRSQLGFVTLTAHFFIISDERTWQY